MQMVHCMLCGIQAVSLLYSFGVCSIAVFVVRTDLGGAWSDTPPICYEHGGKVTTLAIRWKDGVR